MKRLFRYFFPKKTLWPYCTISYIFPPWPDRDISKCGIVSWKYTPKKG